MSRMYGTSSLLSGILEELEISRLNLPTNPLRFTIEGIEDLASSINQKGLLNPLTVRIKDSQTFEIVAGTRRFHACKMLGWRKLPCLVVNLDEKESFVVSLIENIQRHSMNVLEEARAYKKYVDDFGWGGITELAVSMGKSASYVTKKIQLLDLPSSVLDSLVNATLKSSVAEELCTIKNKEHQSILAEIISTKKLSFRKSRELLKSFEFDVKYVKTKNEVRIENIIKSLEKGIITLRMAMNRISELTENNTDDDFIVRILMHHKNLLHEQIDDLIREKKKASKIK